MLRELFAQVENTLPAEAKQEIAKDPVGFFQSFVAVWQSLVNEVLPAFQALWLSLGNFWWLLKNFLADWIGEPLLKYLDPSSVAGANDATQGLFRSAVDAFWGFFIK